MARSIRNIYDVSPSSGRWIVRKRGETSAAGTFDSKQDAIDYGVTLARANQPSQLAVRNAAGQIESHRTYPNDPFPPRG